jgi:hypothetical protein
MTIETSPLGINFVTIDKGSPLREKYHGCGKAWAAIAHGLLVDFVYMEDFEVPPGPATPVLTMSRAHRDGLSPDCVTPTFRSHRAKSAFEKAAIEAGLAATRVGVWRALSAEIALLAGREKDAFLAHRGKSRERLAKKGEVFSGAMSCYSFCIGV